MTCLENLGPYQILLIRRTSRLDLALANGIEEAANDLRSQITAYEEAKQETRLSLEAKRKSLEILDNLYAGGMDCIAGLYRATGNKPLVASLRPRRRRSRSNQADDPDTGVDLPEADLAQESANDDPDTQAA